MTDDQSFASGMRRVHEALLKEYGNVGEVRFGSEGRYGPVLDWSSERAGLGLLHSSFTGRSDLQSWLHDRQDAFGKLLSEYSGDKLAARERKLRALDGRVLDGTGRVADGTLDDEYPPDRLEEPPAQYKGARESGLSDSEDFLYGGGPSEEIGAENPHRNVLAETKEWGILRIEQALDADTANNRDIDNALKDLPDADLRPALFLEATYTVELAEIAENLHRAELTVLERSNHIDAWVRLTKEKAAQLAPKSKTDTNPRGSGRHEGGINAAVRDLTRPPNSIPQVGGTHSIPIAQAPCERLSATAF